MTKKSIERTQQMLVELRTQLKHLQSDESKSAEQRELLEAIDGATLQIKADLNELKTTI